MVPCVSQEPKLDVQKEEEDQGKKVGWRKVLWNPLPANITTFLCFFIVSSTAGIRSIMKKKEESAEILTSKKSLQFVGVNGG